MCLRFRTRTSGHFHSFFSVNLTNFSKKRNICPLFGLTYYPSALKWPTANILRWKYHIVDTIRCICFTCWSEDMLARSKFPQKWKCNHHWKIWRISSASKSVKKKSNECNLLLSAHSTPSFLRQNRSLMQITDKFEGSRTKVHSVMRKFSAGQRKAVNPEASEQSE